MRYRFDWKDLFSCSFSSSWASHSEMLLKLVCNKSGDEEAASVVLLLQEEESENSCEDGRNVSQND